jgi:nitrous oxidase accessory protein
MTTMQGMGRAAVKWRTAEATVPRTDVRGRLGRGGALRGAAGFGVLLTAVAVGLAGAVVRGPAAVPAHDAAGAAGAPGAAGAALAEALLPSLPGPFTVRGAAHATLQEAVDAAVAGDTVYVASGVHEVGTVDVPVPLVIQGARGAVLDNTGAGGLLQISADGVVVRGLTLRGTPMSRVRDHAAILVEGVDNCVIEGNTFDDNFFGIYLARSSGCRVTGNRLTASADRESAAGNGIHLWNTRDAEIRGNVIRGHRDGIYLEHVQGARLSDNVSEDNLRYGLHFMFSNGNEYVGNTFRRNGAGVAVMYSKDVVVRGNRFEDNWGATAYGLLIKDLYDSTISGNTFAGNTVGLSSEGSIRVELEGNRFVRNGWAVRIMASSQENRFAANDFIENSFDVTTNSRQNYNSFTGNYWSRYTGYDLSGDGVGDVPHRPVRLFALLVQRSPAALVLLRSAFLDVLEVAERVAPVLTPETLVDERPLMKEAVR